MTTAFTTSINKEQHQQENPLYPITCHFSFAPLMFIMDS